MVSFSLPGYACFEQAENTVRIIRVRKVDIGVLLAITQFKKRKRKRAVARPPIYKFYVLLFIVTGETQGTS